MTDGPNFSTASSSSLDGTNSNVSSLGNSLDNSVQTTPSTLFGDVMDSQCAAGPCDDVEATACVTTSMVMWDHD